MHFDRHSSAYRYDGVSGLRTDRCTFLAYRVEPREPVDPWRMESWAVQPTNLETPEGERLIGAELGVHGFLTSAWHSPSDTVYVTDFHGRLFVQLSEPRSGMRKWTLTDLGPDVELHGVWGFDDARVCVWGRDVRGARMWIGSGNTFHPIPAPRGRVTIVRGTEHSLYAAGERGLLCRWNGGGWDAIELGILRPITALSVANDDELWLGTDNGKLFEGTRHGWALRAQIDGPIHDVLQWRDRVLIAGGERGLLELVGRTDSIRPVDTAISAVALDGRDHLLAVAEDYLAVSKDGVLFETLCREALVPLCSERRPHWRG